MPPFLGPLYLLKESENVFHFFLLSLYQNKSMSKRIAADDLLFAGTSLSESIEIIFKDHLISNIIITHSITTAMSVDIPVTL